MIPGACLLSKECNALVKKDYDDTHRERFNFFPCDHHLAKRPSAKPGQAFIAMYTGLSNPDTQLLKIPASSLCPAVEHPFS